MYKLSIMIFVSWSLFCTSAFTQEAPLVGLWVINETLSEVTDDKVEIALNASGQNVKRGFFNRDKEYYRGGPVEQEMYDFISYEKSLLISFDSEEYTFTYGEFVRPVFMDNRGASVSLSSMNDVEDFSFGNWENDILLVEGRPRDGGFTVERYELSEDGRQLSVQLYIQPQSFRVPIELVRVYDRSSENQN